MDNDRSSRQQELVKHEEKQARIDQFLGYYLDRLFADWCDQPEQRKITLIARSPASPVARALIANADDLRAAGSQLRLLFAKLEPREALGDWFDFALSCRESEAGAKLEIRHIANPAMIDAHEQLVLGVEMSWTGDAMRRDPLSRDTIEVYDPCCDRTARESNLSFAGIWERSRPVPVRDQARARGGASATSSSGDGAPTPPLPGASGKPAGTNAATRH